LIIQGEVWPKGLL